MPQSLQLPRYIGVSMPIERTTIMSVPEQSPEHVDGAG